MRRAWILLPAALACAGLLLSPVTPAAEPSAGPVMLVFSSYRVHPGYPRLYYYHHDGIAKGELTDGPPIPTGRSDFDPYLTPDGKILAFNVEEEGKQSRIMLWDVPGKRALDLPAPPATAVDMAPCVAADGKRLVYSTLFRGGPSGWNLLVQDLPSGASVELPGLNSDDDDRMPSLSGDGRWLAFASSRPGGAGLQDIYLYDIGERRLVPLPGVNSPSRETEPCISADGRWLAFISTRPARAGARAGSGSLDVYLYDIRKAALVPLPGLNGAGPEQTPALSPDGRYLAFVSERFSGAGGRDVYLYDRESSRLLPTPNLNTARDEMDPALAQVTR